MAVDHVILATDVVTVPADPARQNEDFAAAVGTGSGGVALVLDGVTPPPDGVTGCVHGVPWFVARLGAALLGLAGTDLGRPLRDCLAAAITSTAAAHRSTCDLRHQRTPQATVALLRWDATRVEHLVLSDAVVLLERVDGTVTPVLDPRLDEVVSRPELLALRAGPDRLAYRMAVEALRNAPGGFHTAAATPAVATHAVTGETSRRELRAAAVLSDGATRWAEVFRLGDWAGLFAVLRTEGAAALVRQVRAEEAGDPDGLTHPRGKAFDDASVVYTKLG